MVSRVVPDGTGVAGAQELARELAANAQVALTQAKRALNASQSLDIESGVLFEAEAYQACLADGEWRDRMAAARERRSR
jgi:enoyl-CoA hydratase/carnithine racemase